MAKEANFLTVKYLMGLGQNPAVTTSTQIFHVAPWVPLRQNMLVAPPVARIEEFLKLNFFLVKVMGEL